jgi:hypothetical protein
MVSLVFFNSSVQRGVLLQSNELSLICEESDYFKRIIETQVSESTILLYDSSPTEACAFLVQILQSTDLVNLKWKKVHVELSCKWKIARCLNRFSDLIKVKLSSILNPINTKNIPVVGLNGLYVMDLKACTAGQLKFKKHPYVLIVKRSFYIFFVTSKYGELSEVYRTPRKQTQAFEILSYENFKSGRVEVGFHNPLHTQIFWEMVDLSMMHPEIATDALNSKDSLACYLAFNKHLWSEELIRKHFMLNKSRLKT